MKRSKRKTAAILASSIAVNIACGMMPVRALNPNDVLNDTMDELQQHIVNYIFIKNYVSGNISLSNDFKVKLDYNNDGVINIMDASRAKNKILDLAQKQPPSTTTTTTTTTTSVTTTTPASTTTSAVKYDNLKIGDKVEYTGPAHFMADGTGKTVDVSGTFTVKDILPGDKFLYSVQLENTGWVSYEKLTGKKQPAAEVTTASTTKTPVTTTTPAVKYDNLKIGDKVEYTGPAHFMADGTGKTVDVSGTFTVKDILPGDKYLYSVQLENTGWVSYEKLTGKKQPSSSVTTVTTAKAPASTTAGTFKKGDKVQYSGKAYYTANGGTSVDVSGTYKIVDIVTGSNYKYHVQLENAGWVPYDSIKPAATTTATTKVTTAVTTTKAPVVTTAPAIKKGDKVQYSGKAYYTANGGTSVDVSGTYKVVDIVTGSNYKYHVQLENAGWVPYESLKLVTAATTTTTTIQTKAATSATTAAAFKKGDKVQYSGKAYYTANGGTSVDVSGTYKIVDIVTGTNYKYHVQLENAGWVPYDSLKPAATTTTKVTTTAATTTTKAPAATTAATFKKGDKVQYSGKAYYTANGGTSVDVSGTYKIVDIVTGTNYKYHVQLENAGWVPYDSIKPAAATTTKVTTASTVTTTSQTTKPSTIKEGDKVQYSGKAYYTANGGTSVDVSGTFTIKAIVTGTDDKYTVQLDKAGWVSYEEITGKKQDTAAVETLDGNTYKIKNASSGKYITVGGTKNNSNVYQSSSNDGKEQKFTFKLFYNSLNCYRMYACCSTEHKVIDIVKDSDTKVSNGCNVQLYEDVDPDAQTWDIISAGNNKYKIVSHKNSSVAMTASGSGDGSSAGIASSSAGNVYLSTYTGADSQLWYLEKTN